MGLGLKKVLDVGVTFSQSCSLSLSKVSHLLLMLQMITVTAVSESRPGSIDSCVFRQLK